MSHGPNGRHDRGGEDPSRLDLSRRTLFKTVASGLAVAGLSASGVGGHPTSGDHGNEGHEHVLEDDFGMTNVGYHSLGGVGSESLSGSPDEPHYGGLSELRVKGDIAACGLISSKSPTVDRGVALLDVSAYTRAESREELERAEMTVLSFIPNEDNATSVMDVKFSDDGQYLFVTQQPVAALFAVLAGNAPEARSEGDSFENPEHAGVLAVDVSNPGDPEILGRQEYAFGMHNCYHHRIGGEDYVFGVTGPLGDPAGVYVHRFDRTSGELELVNFWAHDAEYRQGEVGDPTNKAGLASNEYYAHDITVIDDPVTGDPYAYLANWGTEHDSGNSKSGARVLDVSDPADIEELGVFTMERAHTIEPIRRTVNGKRLFVVGQENPNPDADTGDGSEKYTNERGHTGHYYLVDATGVEKDDVDLGAASLDTEESTAGDELAKWVWRTNAAFDDFTYSAHNIDIIDTEVDGTRRLFVTAGHYHAGTRVLEIGYPGGPAVSEEDRQGDPYDDLSEDEEPISEGGNPSGSNGWLLAETGWSRTHFNTPPDSKFGSLSAATPYRWGAVGENGVIFSSDISTGVYAMRLDDPAIPVGTRTVHEASATLEDDGSTFTAGQTNQVTITVETEAPVEVRLNVPRLWEVVAGDPHEEREVADNRLVEFDEPADGSTKFDVFLEPQEAPTGTVYTLGPVEVTSDVDAANDQQIWEALPDTEDANVVVGRRQPS
ncbi:hypothetical protein BRC90_10350 [Halobacteriales archaeon QS_4_69_34]|nr:MAG: hypothetical protein BRC90_10350 [Halobacteriales archaeon QS_4_69_34]